LYDESRKDAYISVVWLNEAGQKGKELFNSRRDSGLSLMCLAPTGCCPPSMRV